MTVSSTGIAIVGYACRLPGAADADAFWSVLSDGRCVIGQVDPDRWSTDRFAHPDRSAPGRSYTFAAGQLDDVWGFDPGFFGISPREAVQMDPQQRLLLQVTWEALEHAGIRPSSLAGSETGVFVGVSGLDHSNLFIFDPAAIDTSMMTGNTLSIASNRISYVFDLVGPSFTVDTACSSSLVALHQAAEAMRNGRIETAIVGGVNILLSPMSFIGFSRASMLSPTGLCRAFDADGDGYVRSEGAVVVVLKTVAAALASGDRILGVIEGSGVNSDGRTNGLSLPSAERQAQLLLQVYETFSIDPARLGFIEAHGTGTRVGDPAEARALGTVLGRRREAVLPIGSAKTNVGHLEAASGMVGLLKAQLALEKNVIPPSLHLRTPNPDIDFAGLNLSVVTQPLALEPSAEPHRAGINSFGFGGANAHVVIRQPTASEAKAGGGSARSVAPVLLSARSKESLAGTLARLRQTVEAMPADADVAALSNAYAWRRERHEHRLVLPARSRSDLVDQIERAMADRLSVPGGRTTADGLPVAFLYSGNGSQWAGMGRHLFETDSVFRGTFEAVDDLFRARAEWSLSEALVSADSAAALERTDVAQPLLFALQVALTRALEARGLKPAAVAGHSVGEVAAAWACGAIDLPTAVHVIHARSVHQQTLHGTGAMAAVLIGPDAANDAIAGGDYPTLAVAAVNSPRSITISGAMDEVLRFGKFCKAERWAYRRLKLSYPFHSRLVDPIREAMAEDLRGLTVAKPHLPFFSTVAGRDDPDVRFDGDYWWDNVRRPVHFQAALVRMAESGVRVFLEIGPKPILTGYITDSLAERFSGAIALGTLESGENRADIGADAIVGQVLAHGGTVDDAAYFGPKTAFTVSPPAYSWNNTPHRLARTDEAIDVFGRGHEHLLLGSRVIEGSGPFLGQIDPKRVPYLSDHKVQESIVFPAAGFVEMVIAAARADGMDGPIEIADLEVLSPLMFQDDAYDTRVDIQADGGLVSIWARRRLSREDWRLHARATVSRSADAAGGSGAMRGSNPIADLVPAVSGEIRSPAELYELTKRFGLHYGPAFRTVTSVRRLADQSLAVELAGSADETHHLHPTVLDGAFHALFLLIEQGAAKPEAGTSFLPVRIGRLIFRDTAFAICGARVTVERASARSIRARIDLVDRDGEPVVQLSDVRFKAVALERVADNNLVYVNRSVRLPDALTGGRVPMELPEHPATVARALGLSTETVPDAEAGALLVDAAARRIAWDALSGVFGSGSLDVDLALADGRLAASAAPLVHRLRMALDADGAIIDDRFADDCPYPDQRTLITALVAEAPQRIGETMALMRVSAELAHLLKEGLPETSRLPPALDDHLATSAPISLPLCRALSTLGVQIATTWPDDRPLSVLTVGGDSVRLANTLLDTGRLVRAVACDPSDERTGRLSIVSEARPRLDIASISSLADGPLFDLVLFQGCATRARDALPAVVALLATHGSVVVAAPEPSLFADLVWGTGAEWWSGTLDPARPIGARLPGRDWEIALSELRLRSISRSVVASGTVAASLVFAEAQRLAPDPRTTSEAPVVVLTDRVEVATPISAEIIRGLHAAGRSVEIGVVDSDGHIRSLGRPDEHLLAVLKSDQHKDVVHLQQMDMRADLTTRISDRAMALQDLVLRQLRGPARLWIVAPGGNLAHHGDLDVAGAAIWGLGRVLTNELADLDIRLVDVQGTGGIERFLEELAQPSDEKETVFDDRGRYGIRVEPAAAPPESGDLTDGETRLVLSIPRQGSLDSLTWRPAPKPDPEADAVEIAVTATGLNFRDVMWAQGLLPEEALEDGFAGPTLGMECSGVVTRVGPLATRVNPGDRVLAFAPAAFASHVTVPESAVMRLPDGIDLEAAATIPVAFLTAAYSLEALAKLEAGEVVLVHGGAGGVGLAALQIALACGARVFATAGSPEKRRLLTLLGAEQVFDSRSLAFEAEVMRATGGLGVDVVLNSLSGDAMERSIRCLKPFGRFVELGKRDFYANRRIGLRPFRQNLSYFGVDADQLLAARPALTATLLGDLLSSFATGKLTPLPYRVFEAAEVTDAFRLMQQSGHTGKVLVRPPVAECAIAAGPGLRADATYLIAGGLGGFGIETARFLVEKGARHIALTSRSGIPSQEASEAIGAMRSAGARVEIFAGDIADRATVDAILGQIDRSMPMLRGVFHTAMILDDALFANLDRARFETVLRPKVSGASHLDKLTRSRSLDHFVLFSSATTLVGNPGQANYVAANAALEQIAARRRQAGLPGLAIGWGAISDVGYLARNATVRSTLSSRLGRDALSAREALTGLWWAMRGNSPPALAYARMDWGRANRELPIMAGSTLSAVAATVEPDAPESGMADGLAALLGQMDSAAALKAVSSVLSGELSRILRLPAEAIDADRPLAAIGMDSLMAVELKAAAEQRLGVDIPLLALANGATLTEIASRIVDRARGAADGHDVVRDTILGQHLTTGMDDAVAFMSEVEERSGTVRKLSR